MRLGLRRLRRRRLRLRRRLWLPPWLVSATARLSCAGCTFMCNVLGVYSRSLGVTPVRSLQSLMCEACNDHQLRASMLCIVWSGARALLTAHLYAGADMAGASEADHTLIHSH